MLATLTCSTATRSIRTFSEEHTLGRRNAGLFYWHPLLSERAPRRVSPAKTTLARFGGPLLWPPIGLVAAEDYIDGIIDDLNGVVQMEIVDELRTLVNAVLVQA
jgi:hypothetical protein